MSFLPEDETRALDYFMERFKDWCDRSEASGRSTVIDARELILMTGKWVVEAYRHGKQTENVAN